MVGFGRPILGRGLRGVERGFDRVKGALPAPQEPAGERGVFDEVARVGSFGRVFFDAGGTIRKSAGSRSRDSRAKVLSDA